MLAKWWASLKQWWCELDDDELPTYSLNDTLRTMIMDHNWLRQQYESALPLVCSSRLTEAAQKHALWMAKHRQLRHDADGLNLMGRLTCSGYPFVLAGENLARGPRGVATVIKAWLQQAATRALVVNPAFWDIGVGVAVDTNSTPYWCVVYAQPRFLQDFMRTYVLQPPGVDC